MSALIAPTRSFPGSKTVSPDSQGDSCRVWWHPMKSCFCLALGRWSWNFTTTRLGFLGVFCGRVVGTTPEGSAHKQFRRALCHMYRSSAVCQHCSVGVFALVEKLLDPASCPLRLSIAFWVVKTTCYMLKFVCLCKVLVHQTRVLGPLSEKTIPGMPSLAKLLLVHVIPSVAVSLFSWAVFVY